VAIYSRIPTPPETIVTRFAFGLGEGQTFTNTGRQLVAMSPDGTKMVYVASQRLWLRPMSDLEARPIAGTVSATPAGITNPVFSPDGQSIVFYSLEDRALKRVPAAGGTAVTIAPASNPFGLSWNGGVLVFGQADAGIMRVPETGGTPETIVRAREGEAIHGPQLLPGGEWLLYTMTTATGVDRWEKSEAIVQRISSDERRTILGGATDARYLPTGHLVYTVRGAMFAVRFDLNRLQTAGGPVAVLEGIAQAVGGTNTPSAHWSVSNHGSLMYVPGSVAALTRFDLGYLDRKGSVERLNLPTNAYSFPRRSPDGRTLAVLIGDEPENLWIYDVTGVSAIRRLTFGGAKYPVWSGDSQYIAFQSDRDGELAIYRQRADTPGTAERLTRPEAGQVHVPHAWSRDGNTLLFSVGEKDVFTLHTFSIRDKKVVKFEDVTSGNQLGAVLSPDGQWVAYHSNLTERRIGTVFVRPFPPNTTRYQIADGANPWWSADGKELLFATGPGNPIHAVPVTISGDFRVGRPVPIPRIGVASFDPVRGRNFDNAPDGRLLVVVNAGNTTPAPTSISVVLNWFDELKARVPVQ
jgi:hypothetical protein